MSRVLAELGLPASGKIIPADAPADLLLRRAREFVEQWLRRALPARDMSPQRLHGAMHDAVFPGGRRARPLLCRLIADHYAAGDDELVGRMAAAVELVHCASLVQDDLPCFDDADVRRGQPSCHRVHGVATAILVGDALLNLAFETLASAPPRRAPVALHLIAMLSAATGSCHGVIGGQALELEPGIEIGPYHRQKTAELFRVAAAGAAVCCAAENDVPRWGRVGELIGCALQIRDDIDDVAASVAEVGKPTGRDAQLGRPNTALQEGADNASALRQALLDGVRELLGPPSPETDAMHRLVEEVTRPCAGGAP